MNISRHNSIDAIGHTHTTATATEQSHTVQTPKPPSTDSDSSLQRPVKKAKASTVMSSDEDSGDSKKKNVMPKVGNTAKARGTRQPIKRGAKRF